MATPDQPASGGDKKGGYGKRPLWQWILLYVIVGGILYFGVYYYLSNRSSSNSNGTATHSLY